MLSDLFCLLSPVNGACRQCMHSLFYGRRVNKAANLYIFNFRAVVISHDQSASISCLTTLRAHKNESALCSLQLK